MYGKVTKFHFIKISLYMSVLDRDRCKNHETLWPLHAAHSISSQTVKGCWQHVRRPQSHKHIQSVIKCAPKHLSFCSNIDSKSSNNTYLNIIEILFVLLFFSISCLIYSADCN